MHKLICIAIGNNDVTVSQYLNPGTRRFVHSPLIFRRSMKTKEEWKMKMFMAIPCALCRFAESLPGIYFWQYIRRSLLITDIKTKKLIGISRRQIFVIVKARRFHCWSCGATGHLIKVCLVSIPVPQPRQTTSESVWFREDR